MKQKNNRKNILLITAALIITAVLCFCVISSAREVYSRLSFTVSTDAGEESVSLYEDGDTLYAFLPSYADMSTLKLSYPDGSDPIIAGKSYQGEGFFEGYEDAKEVSLSVRSYLGIRLPERRLVIMKSAEIPALSISLIGGSLSDIDNSPDHQVSRAGTCTLIKADGTVDYSGKLDSLSGRGNVTWEEDKKPYNIEFKSPTNLLGMGGGLRYCLLANALDKSNLRDKIVYDAAIEAGLPYSTESEFVDLYVDGAYLGLYLMTEDVRLADDRVSITDLAEKTASVNPYQLINYTAAHSYSDGVDKRYLEIPDDPDDITGGYLIELDMVERYDLFNSGFVFDGNDYCYTLKSPKYASKAEVDYISELFRAVEDDFAADRINERIDLESWVRYYLVQEVFANFDPCSVYFFKDTDSADGKIYAGPIWDFDKALGSPVYEGTGSPDKLYAAEHTIFSKMCASSEFTAYARQIYEKEFIPIVEDFLSSRIPAYAAQISASAKMNELRWRNIKLHSWEPVFGNCDEHISYVVNFLGQRMSYLTSEWLDADIVTVDYVSYSPVQELGFFTANNGETLGELPVLTCEGYSFDGWYDSVSGELYDPAEVLTENKTYVARWTKTSSDSFLNNTITKLETFADNQNWTFEKLINYAVAGGLVAVFGLILVILLISGALRRPKRRKESRRP